MYAKIMDHSDLNDGRKLLALCLLVIIPAGVIDGFTGITCETPQYAEIRTQGVLKCAFPQGFYGVYWYNSSESTEGFPVISLVDDTKSGPGYLSGEYDISSNGSLLINNVTLGHNHCYRTVMLYFENKGGTEVEDVDLIVTASPLQRHPSINLCGGKQVCYKKLEQGLEISCLVNARPPVSLTWSKRTRMGDHNVTYSTFLSTYKDWLTTRVTTTESVDNSVSIFLLVCKEITVPHTLPQSESMVLVEKAISNISSLTPVQKYFQHNTVGEMECTTETALFLVWRGRAPHDSDFHEISYAVFNKDSTHSEVLRGPEIYGINDEGSLILPNIGIGHEGLYTCVYGDGISEGLASFEVATFVPSFPVVEGCNHHQYCVLEIQLQGFLTCAVNGIRPLVKLEWRLISSNTAATISFHKDEIATTGHTDGTFDVSLTSYYLIKPGFEHRLTIECRISEDIPELPRLKTTLDILFQDDLRVTSASVTTDDNNWLFWVLGAAALILIVTALTASVLWNIKRRKKRSKTKVNEPRVEEISMIGQNEDLSLADKKTEKLKEKFIKQLRGRYKVMYEAVQPIPYLRERLLRIDKVFVEGGIEFLLSKEEPTGKEYWRDLHSYHDIFNDNRVKSVRQVIEGDPGYGKSTLTLQLAFDWCTAKRESSLKDVEILIILRLRDLGGILSIFRAIKQFLLPGETSLEEKDIKNIICNSKSVVMVFDGFDEYPYQGSESDVMKILASEMFQDVDIILTTRSSCRPKRVIPLPKRMKLTGFDERARDEYIRKAVVSDNDQNVFVIEKIKRSLRENVVLGDLCQVPLFFVMFAHITHEGPINKDRKFNSVTSFFRYMITCFHHHMKNKLKDKKLQQFEEREACHSELDRIAFEGLSKEEQQLVWTKEELVTQLGKKFYKHYTRIGILVEEEVLQISDEPGTKITEHVRYIKNVRFYHKLFCEWYAAHHLTNLIAQSSFNECTKVLKKLDPYDLQYTFRFACGLKPDLTDNITSHLGTDASNLAILCMLEQTGDLNCMKDTIRDLCGRDITFKENDNKLLQRTTIQIMKIASDGEIPIHQLRLLQCFHSASPKDEILKLSTGLQLPRLSSLEQLVIVDPGREFTNEEVNNILKYCLSCFRENFLCDFFNCILPGTISDPVVLQGLRSREIKVGWGLCNLNLETGLWMEGGKTLTEEDYEGKVQFHRRRFQRFQFSET